MSHMPLLLWLVSFDSCSDFCTCSVSRVQDDTTLMERIFASKRKQSNGHACA